MKQLTVAVLGLLVFILVVVTLYPSTGSKRIDIGYPASLAPIVKTVLPSIVNISTTGGTNDNTVSGPAGLRPGSLGSGVIIDAKRGYILTNDHVIQQNKNISVTLFDGRTVDAHKIANDTDLDIAILQIHAEHLDAIPAGDSDTLEIGDFVLALGNPFGLGQTATSGIVSALGRSLGHSSYAHLIQTDAAINPGNSGGALINLNGELVGINTAILSPRGNSAGIGFAVPVNLALNLLQQVNHDKIQSR